MSRLSAADYYEFHESKESLCEGVHPALRPRRPSMRCHWRCKACGMGKDGKGFDFDELTEDGLCFDCDAAVKELEEGRI